ncbi:hypothetical protein [Erwinia billingiae]|uniref:hypothetical protein n=1 Tax=Erwinia billingiae TaxID=182337 RepID=UPI0032098EE1
MAYNLSNYFALNVNNNKNLIRKELKYLKIETRNKVRSIVSMEAKESIKSLEKIREHTSANEIIRIENAVRAISFSNECIIPELFPMLPQVKEAFFRLKSIDINKNLELIEINVRNNHSRLACLIKKIGELNSKILSRDFIKADECISEIKKEFGCSHLLIRKCALLQSLDIDNEMLEASSSLLRGKGITTNNVIVNSIVQCYQEKQDYLALKKSVLNISDKGKYNRYTRDITRFIFHPHSIDPYDFNSILQSCLQSSLIDAIIFLKINKNHIEGNKYPFLWLLFEEIENHATNVDLVAKFYTEYKTSEIDLEYLFYKHSSAWLEGDTFNEYRFFLDLFYEDPESKLCSHNTNNIEKCRKWISVKEVNELLGDNLTLHKYNYLKKLEILGMVTRTAAFNFLVHLKEGFCYLSEENLYLLMGKTKDLDKTIHIQNLIKTAQFTDSDESKIIYYLLIAKKSKNEGDGFYLRRIVQKIVIEKYSSDIVSFSEQIYSKSKEVAEYTYEVFSEDFLARLSHVIKRTPQITETRAALHKWMGEKTGKKAFLDRARTLLIDHQINRVRNEIDDNRIYVDSARFIEWVKDEQAQNLNIVLTNITHIELSDVADDPQLIMIIEKCYFAFCNNNIFGISSYLGRRIRHGTFRGHLFNNVVNIERNYPALMRDQLIQSKWNQWKVSYESCIDKIIKDNLHVESGNKRDGLLKPNLKSLNKHDIVFACASFIAKDFMETRDTNNTILIILEYCWRLAEVDLKNVNRFLKSKRSELINAALLEEMKSCTPYLQNTSRDFAREVQATINEKLTSMYGWFKRPLSVSPKASLSLLYKAVVAEVKETFPQFDADTKFDEENDIELVGGPYHVLYDAFYVVIYNAAKHGKPSSDLVRKFEIDKKLSKVLVTISSNLKEEDSDVDVNERLKITSESDIDNAQSSEERSGIRKLYHLERNDPKFRIERIISKNKQVTISVSYSLEH